MAGFFPHDESHVTVDGDRYTVSEILEWLGEYVTPERNERLTKVVAQRTYALVPVTDRVFDRGNISAIMRTAESLGCQAFHIIRSPNESSAANRVARGADHWLDVRRWERSDNCIHHLKEKGYRICATSLGPGSKPVEEIDFTQPVALVLGNEKDGVSDQVLELADDRIFFPMQGLTQSYNVSVAAAVGLYHAYMDRTRRLGRQGDLTEAQQQRLMADYVVKSVNRCGDILRRKRADCGKGNPL